MFLHRLTLFLPHVRPQLGSLPVFPSLLLLKASQPCMGPLSLALPVALRPSTEFVSSCMTTAKAASCFYMREMKPPTPIAVRRSGSHAHPLKTSQKVLVELRNSSISRFWTPYLSTYPAPALLTERHSARRGSSKRLGILRSMAGVTLLTATAGPMADSTASSRKF